MPLAEWGKRRVNAVIGMWGFDEYIFPRILGGWLGDSPAPAHFRRMSEPTFMEAEVVTNGQEPGSQSLAKRISKGVGWCSSLLDSSVLSG